MEIIATIIITIVILAIIALFTFGCCQIMAWHTERVQRKRKEKHPHLWKLFDEVSAKSREVSRQYNRNVAPLKRQIQYILDRLPYWPEEIREVKEEEAENLRLRLYGAQLTYDVLEAELEEIRKEIREYVSEHDLNWAKNWGW